jgi:small GTP-binding protein
MNRRLVFLGDSGVGKTSICHWLQLREFNPQVRQTVGANYTLVPWTVDGQEISLQVWDTAGQERFRSIAHTYYRDAQAIVLVFSLTDAGSFQRLDSWITELRQHTLPAVPVVVFANKSDLTDARAVTRDDIELWQCKSELPLWEISVATGDGLQPAFDYVVQSMVTPSPQFTTVDVDAQAADKIECCW